MDLITIIFIAIGLSMDSFAVSVSNGLSIKNLRFNNALIIAMLLSIFQGLMPVIGWSFGIGVEKYIKEIDHWVAFILLGIIGAKMLYEGVTNNKERQIVVLNLPTIIIQSIATSIDALIIGISFALLGWSIILPAIIIGITTFLFSMTGMRIGKEIGPKFGKSAAIIGGITLIGIGTKILIEHLFLQ
jgi:putative Mn2+ efflux pump MntP